MFKYVDTNGHTQEVTITAEELMQAPKANNQTPQQYLNTKFKDANLAIGSAFKQMQASIGIQRAGAENIFGLRPTSMATLLANEFSANTQQNSSPYGTASRAFTVISIIDAIEAAVAKDRTTDIDSFYSMVGTKLSINSEHFEQPVIDYNTVNGPEQASSQRVAQGANPPNMAFFTTADRVRRIGSWSIGLAWSDAALRATTLDYVTMTMARYLSVEMDLRAYRYLSDLFLGNGDLVVGAVTGTTTVALDAACVAKTISHKAWVKWLARNRKYRKLTHVICDLDTYLLIEGRSGRPGSNAYDPRMVGAVDPQALMMNVGFGNGVKVFLVDSAADGGPVPANTVWGVDASSAITLVTNANAAYQAVESFAMKRSTSMRLDHSAEVFRTFGDSDLRLFDVLEISQ